MNEISKDGFTPKSFWNRPEGTTGMLTIAGIGIAGFFLAKSVLPTIIAVLGMAVAAVGKAIALTAMGAVLFVMLYILTNAQFQSACRAVFKNSMRWVTGMIVEIDPIGIMKNYIDSLKAKKVVMDENVSALSGQLRVIDGKIAKNTETMKNAMGMVKAAKEQGNQMQLTLSARSAGRMEKSNMTYQAMKDKMTVLYRALKKYQEAVDVTIADLTEEVAVKDDERKAIIAASRAMRGAMAILTGGGPEKELFDQAMEFTVQDYGQRLGEIDDFMITTKSILDGIDLQNGVYDAAALDKLSAWEEKADSIVLGGSKRLMLEDIQTSQLSWNHSSQGEKVPAGSSDDFAQFFNKN